MLRSFPIGISVTEKNTVAVVKTAHVVVGKVSELEPKLAKLCEAQGRGENVLERNDSSCQKPQVVLRLAIGVQRKERMSLWLER